MKEKYFWIAMAVIVAAWVANYTYLKAQMLDSPIILSHYYEIPYEERTSFEIYYLTNKDHQELNYVDMNGVLAYPSGDEDFPYVQQQPQHVQEYRHYYLKKVRLEIPDHMLNLEKGSGHVWTTNDVIPHFSMGNEPPQQPVEIGQLSIKAGYPGPPVFNHQMSGSSNTNRSYSTKTAKERLTVESFEIPYQEELADSLNIKISINKGYNPIGKRENWGDIPGAKLENVNFPIKLDKGETISVFVQTDDDLKSYLWLALKLRGKTADGRSFESPILMNSHPSFSQAEIAEIVDAKEEEE